MNLKKTRWKFESAMETIYRLWFIYMMRKWSPHSLHIGKLKNIFDNSSGRILKNFVKIIWKLEEILKLLLNFLKIFDFSKLSILFLNYSKFFDFAKLAIIFYLTEFNLRFFKFWENYLENLLKNLINYLEIKLNVTNN